MIVYTLNLIQSHLRKIGRSGQWKTIEKHFKEANDTCAACGSKKRLQVHHIKPFRSYPELELDPTNLITLCMSKNQCHLFIGHGNNWKCFNENVVDDSNLILSSPKSFKKIAEKAEKLRSH